MSDVEMEVALRASTVSCLHANFIDQLTILSMHEYFRTILTIQMGAFSAA